MPFFSSWLRRFPPLCVIGLVVTVLVLAPPAGLTPTQAHIAALVAGTIGLWASGLVPESLAALAFFTFAMLGKMAPADVVFAGFTSSAVWLIFSGLVLGAAMRRSGLADRIALHLAAAMGGGYRGALVGVVLFGLAMAFLMPSAMGRIALMLPILSTLAERLGHPPGSRGRSGLVLGGVLGTYLPSTAILPANVPNNVLAGIAETTLGRPLAFGDYLLVHFPVLGLAKAGLLLALLLFSYRGISQGTVKTEPLAPLSPPEGRLVAVLAVALALWTTDSLHHVSPAWIGMAAAILCLLPPLGLLPATALRGLNLEPVFYVGAIVSLGALFSQAGLGQRLGEWVLTRLTPGQGIEGFVMLCALSTLVGLATTLPGVPAVLTPLTDSLAAATGLPPASVLIAQVVGFSTPLLPCQAPPLVMALQVEDLPRIEMARLTLLTGLFSIALLWPLDVLWLTLLGRI